MSITLSQLALYSGALVILWLTPGPVWLAIIARGLSGGFRAVVPLAFGVALGDIFWPLLAILGLNAAGGVYGDIVLVVRYIGMVLFIVMGVTLIRYAGASIGENKALTRPGLWAGFLGGLMAVIANPKAILFYLGLLPSFFRLDALGPSDIAIICLVSALVPFLGNLMLGRFLGLMRRFLQSPQAVRRTNIIAGSGMIAVGIMIGLAN